MASSSLCLLSSDSGLPSAMEEDGEYRNWAELPPELTSSILHRLGAIEMLENAQKVCRSWRRVCKDPSMWRKIDMHNFGNLGDMNYDLEILEILEIMCRHAIDRSQGGLVEIDVWYFGTEELLNYIAESSSNLRKLKLAMCYSITDEGFMEAVVKLPLLEDLELSYCSLSGESLNVLGKSCPNLKTLKVNCAGYRQPQNESNDDALAIAETMPRLRHLQLFGNGLSDTGLIAILDNCPNLEHLDLRQCFNVKLVGDLWKRCSERIKVVKRPHDSTHDYPYDATVIDMGSSEDDYPYGFSDNDLMSDGDYDDYNDISGASDHSEFELSVLKSSSITSIESDSSSSSSSTSVSSLMKDEELRNWAELPPELTSSILVRLSSIDILENAQKVCRSWRRICQDPSMWQKIDMDNLGDLGSMGYDLEIMCRHAVDRSQGGLVEIYIWYFGTDELLSYIADRTSNLRSLSLIMCYPIADEGFVEAVVKLPLLEYLELSHCELSGEALKVAGQSCPNLKTLKLNSDPDPNFNDDEFNNDEALAIAESMPELRHLQLFGNILTNVGLNAILDGCPHLEHLDLRKCFNINFAGDIEKRCLESIKDVKRPNDSTAGHPYGSFPMNGNYGYSDYYGY